MTETHEIRTTIETGAEIVTVHEGTEKEARAIHGAEVMLAREIEAVAAITGQGESAPMGDLCAALERLDGACAQLASVVGDGVEALGCVDPDALPRVGPRPEVANVPPVAWTADEAIVREETAKGVRWSVRSLRLDG